MKTLCLFPYIVWKSVLFNSFLLLLIAGCDKKSGKEEFLSTLIKYETSGKQVLLFVPLDGCGTCIQNSSKFINEKLLNTEFLKAYTYSLYNKKYKQFDSRVLQCDRFVQDPESKILSALKVEQKPRAIFLKDGKIVEDLFYDNGNDSEVFRKIMNF